MIQVQTDKNNNQSSMSSVIKYVYGPIVAKITCELCKKSIIGEPDDYCNDLILLTCKIEFCTVLDIC